MRFLVRLFIVSLVSACADHPVATRPSVQDAIAIYALQGSGEESPLLNRRVAVTGIVTGDFQRHDANEQNQLGGFFLQDEAGDGDAGTSDAVFVVDNARAPDVRVGDRLLVAGQVVEQGGETRIVAEWIEVIGAGAVAPTDVRLPAGSATTTGDGAVVADLEALEGMLVRFPQTLVVVDAYGLERDGSLTLSADGRIETFTNREQPNRSAYRSHREHVTRSTLLLDDGLDVEYQSPPRYLFPYKSDHAGDALRLGDEVTGLAGNLHVGRGGTWRVMPAADPSFHRGAMRPDAPAPQPGAIRVMSFNALNFFTTPDAGQDSCGPLGRSGCRGAGSVAELERQRSKLATAILAASADIVGLMEVENNARSSLDDIVSALNERSAGDEWAYVDTGVLGSDAIRVGLVYKRQRVRVAGRHAVLDSSIDARFNDQKNRPALAQTFEPKDRGGRLTVAVNHLKSKGSNCDELGDPDTGDGQGNCNVTRTQAARALADWLAGDPTASGDADVLIIGDLNAYLREDPVRALEAAGYANVVDRFVGAGAYSYVFRGEFGALDHALASPSLLPQVAAAAEWHINADEPPVLDYNLDRGRDPRVFDADAPFRASDHDPVLVDLVLTLR